MLSLSLLGVASLLSQPCSNVADEPTRCPVPPPFCAQLQLLPWQLPLLESCVTALARGWMLLLVGGPASGEPQDRMGA